MKWPWQKNELDIEFVDTSRKVYHHFPIVTAKEMKPRAYETQKANSGQFKFAHCPGMIDYAQMGYIIPAWTDIHIKANKAGSTCIVGDAARGIRGFMPPRRMDPDLVTGFWQPEGIPLSVYLLSSPWGIFSRNNVSAHLVAPYYHASWLDDLHVWAGTVDYNKFHVSNFVFSPKRECEVHIKAGDPLIHVIPFHNKEMRAGFGPGSQEQLDLTSNEIPTGESHYYRKNLRQNKKFAL